jgi:cytosine/adenosine deaminase-related metal-dependent hydrolase
MKVLAKKTLLRGGHVITMDPKLGELDGDVLIEGDRIAEVAPSIDAAADETIDVAGAIVTPGLIDCHIHLWQTPVRGVAAGCWGREYFGVVHPLSARMRAEDMRVAAYAGAVELLSYGVTSAFDFCHSVNSPEHAEASLDALDAAGIRALFGYSFRDRPEVRQRGFESLDDRIAVLRRIQAERGDGRRVQLAAALNNIDHVTPEDHARELGAARELGLRSSVHSNLDEQVTQAWRQQLLGSDVLWVHCGAISDPELQLLADHGGTVVASPEIEAGLMSITPIVGRALQHGIPVGLGIDVPSAVNGDLVAQMRVAYALDRLVDSQTDRLQGRLSNRTEWSPTVNSRTLLRLGTIEAAGILGLDDVTGSLTPGKLADVQVRSTEPYGLGGGDPVDHLVFQSSARDVDAVFVGGEQRVRDGRVVDVDFPLMRQRLDATRDYVLGRSEDSVWSEMTAEERALYEATQGTPVAT